MQRKHYLEGLALAAGAFVLWGLLPLYWKWVSAISPYEIFSLRVMWSFVFVILVLWQRKALRQFWMLVKSPKNLLSTLAPALFISLNWMGYIWGVNNGYIVEASLGYYINPLVLTLFGRLFFGERLTKAQRIGIGLAAIGVIFKTVTYGRVPYISFLLAVSFGIYGLLKKKSNLSSLNGLGLETLLISIPSTVYFISVEHQGMGISGNLPAVYWWMIALSGAITAIPLLMYAEGTKRLPLSIIGFLQFIAPTISLALGIFVYHEAFDMNALISFSWIWVGLAVFTYDQYKLLSTKRTAKTSG